MGPAVGGQQVLFLFLLLYVFTDILFSVGPPGAPSFVARRKIGEKDTPKGSKAALWNLAFIRGFGGETCLGSTNSHWCNLRDLGPSVACGKHTVSTDSIVLLVVRCIRNTYRITNLICSRKLGGFGCAFVFWGTQKPSQRGRCRRMSADEGMRRGLGIGEPTKTARFVTFFLFRQHKCCHLPHGGRSCQALLK